MVFMGVALSEGNTAGIEIVRERVISRLEKLIMPKDRSF